MVSNAHTPPIEEITATTSSVPISAIRSKRRLMKCPPNNVMAESSARRKGITDIQVSVDGERWR
jgi:hypothetical protein